MARPKKNGADKSSAISDEVAEAARLAAEDARLERLADTKALAVKTMTGDLRDMVLNKLRFEQDKRPWDQRSEGEQREVISAVETAIQDAVRGAVELIAASGLPTIKAHLNQIVVKDGGLKLEVLMERTNEQRHQIMDAIGGTVLLVVADATNYMGERAPVRINPDQLDIEQVAGVVHSSDEADEHADRHVGNGAAGKQPGWRPDRDAVPTSSPLN